MAMFAGQLWLLSTASFCCLSFGFGQLTSDWSSGNHSLLFRSRRAIGAGSCGESIAQIRNFYRNGQRIVGGGEARPQSFPWLVSLQSNGQHFCGGTIVRVGTKDESDIVITAAHCVRDGVRGFYAAAGVHDLKRWDYNQQWVRVAQYVYHPQYSSVSMMNDIAVVKLATPLKFSDYIQPVCLPSPGELVPTNSISTVAGWGTQSENGYRTTSVLQQVDLPIVDGATCRRNYIFTGVRIDESAMICAGYQFGSKDACQGDSGGPLTVSAYGRSVIQGIVSFGLGCARPGYPGIYTRVSNYFSWIQTQIGTVMDTSKPEDHSWRDFEGSSSSPDASGCVTPRLLKPNQRQTFATTDAVAFNWSTSPGAKIYQLTISSKNGYTWSIQTTRNYRNITLKLPGSYDWVVGALCENNVYSSISDIGQIRVLRKL